MVLGGNDFEGRWLGPVVVAARVSVATVVSRVHWVQFGVQLRASNAALGTDAGTCTSRALLGTRVRSNQLGLKQDTVFQESCPRVTPVELRSATVSTLWLCFSHACQLGDQGNVQRYQNIWAIFFFSLAPHRLVRIRKGSFSPSALSLQ